MGWLLPISMGVSALGGLLGNTNGARTGSQSQQYSGTRTTTPVGDPRFTELQDKVIQMYMDRLGQPTSLAGYEGQGMGNINSTYDLGKQSLLNSLTARGLSTSGVAGSGLASLEQGRLGQVANFQNSLPLVERQMRNEDLSGAMQTLALQPYGQTSTESGTSSGTYTQPGSMAGGAFSGLGNLLAFMLGKGLIGGNSGGSSGPFSI